jgi:ribonuclease P protein component
MIPAASGGDSDRPPLSVQHLAKAAGSSLPEEADSGAVPEVSTQPLSHMSEARKPEGSGQHSCDQPRRYTFPGHLRLKRAREFERCFATKISTADDILIVYGYPNQLPYPRLGCVVSRKHGRAVRRNRLKRLLREAFRLLQHELPSGIDYVVLPRPAAEPPRLESVRRSLLRLARRLARRLAEASSIARDRVSPSGDSPSRGRDSSSRHSLSRDRDFPSGQQASSTGESPAGHSFAGRFPAGHSPAREEPL